MSGARASSSPCVPTGPTAMADARRPLVEIEYWTDPLCCWSWAFEPQWRRLRYEFADQLAWRYRMGGMLPDWSTYSDPLNAVSRPMQMGPLWFQVGHVSGMPINDRIWIDDPPGSSYLPCVAVKAAERQSPRAGELYLRRLREAVMLQGRNVARRGVLLEVARELAADRAGAFDADAFARDLDAPPAVEAFREDLRQAGYRSIGRFPSLTLRRPNDHAGIILVGYRPYAALLDAVKRVAPDLRPVRSVKCAGAYAAYWGDLTPRELGEIRADGDAATAAGPGPATAGA